jgi:hypothetical protein
VLDQDPDGHLVREPDVRPSEAALGDLAAERLDVLGDAGGQPVAELGVFVEALDFVVRVGDLKRCPGDLRDAGQRRGGARVEQPRAAPHQRYQEDLGLRVQVQRQHRAVAIRLPRSVRSRSRSRSRGHGRWGPPVPARDGDRNLQPVIEHRA